MPEPSGVDKKPWSPIYCEAHFAQVAQGFLACVERGALPDWEVPGMLAKYHTTTQALEIARGTVASVA